MDVSLGSSGASPATPATVSDLVKHPDEPLDSTMTFEYTEQLLTPENSRSETSSNNENASNEENPTLRRRSTRATRASLRGAAQQDIGSEIENNGAIESIEEKVLLKTLGNAAAPLGKNTRSSRLRHSIAIMESGRHTEASSSHDAMELDDHPMAPDTPVSKSSHESQPDDRSALLLPRTLRKRVEQALARNRSHISEKDTKDTDKDDRTPTRRSSRLSLLEKVSDLAGRATTVLGKRSSSLREKGKEIDRRASLRPRQLATPKEEPILAEEPPAKKRRVSDSELLPKAKSEPDTSQEEPTPLEAITLFKEKRWLTHGLYSGQAYTNARPSQKRTENARRRSLNHTQDTQRKLLPLPMFAGERLLKTGRDFELPFDIYSPLPPGQPKPNEWRKTNKNVFVGEAGSIWRANKEEELSKCTCTPEAGCDQFCQNRYMFYECDNSICGLGPECGNRNFEELKQRAKAGGKYNVGVEVIKTADRGYGVRSNRTFEPNQIIVEYTGEIITQLECEKRMRTLYKKNECYYLMYFDQNMIIDATRGSIARFVNHGCDPNCRMEKWTVAGKPRMALFAGDRGIMTGEELTYDYNFDPYSQKNVQQCRCGSAKCRGILGPRKREKEQREEMRAAKLKEKEDAKKAQAAKRRRENALNKSRSRVTKKRGALAPSSIKSGVKKVVSKARMTVSKASRKPTSATAAKASPKKASANQKRGGNIRLPTIKPSKIKAKTAVRVRKPTQAAESKMQKTTSSSKSRSRVISTKTKTVAIAKSSPAAKRQAKPRTDVLLETINKGTARTSPTTKSPTRVSGRVRKH
ncbi:hypothetical protein BJY04DRAFT_158521 [Aspergillus karnatakaensis]|uniref:putative histone-lysine N-methyltransferase (Ash1) n=1 Tax=Aspergillus karnatakaensis TaxID=1810916 RepID=UPI003CCCAD4A